MKTNTTTTMNITPDTLTGNNIWASYDSKKVEKALNGINPERKAYFEGMGVTLENVTSMESALKISGLDFMVEKKPLYFMETRIAENGKKLPPKFNPIQEQWATVRTDTGTALGVVGKKYDILQNREAFEFLDSMALQGAKFETAGLFKKNGAASYVTMSTEPLEILDDEFDPYIMIVNSHDGSGAIKICMTPIRAICKNSAIIALHKATNSFSITHSRLTQQKMLAAKEAMVANSNYLTALKEEAEKLAVTSFSKEAFEALARKIYPVNEEMSEILQIRNLTQIESLLTAYKQDDLANFQNTAWGALQAFSDHESHPLKIRSNKKLANGGTPEFQVVTASMPMLNMVYKYILDQCNVK